MKRICSIMVTIVVIATIAYLINKTPLITVEKSEDFSTYAAEFKNDLVTQLNSEEVVVTVAGSTVDEYYNFYVDDNMKLMCEVGFLKSFLSCSVLEYVDGTVLVMKGDNKLELHLDTNVAVLNDSEEIELISNVYKDEDTGVIFVPINNVSEHLSYEVEYNFESNWIDLVRLEGEKILPDAYDMRDYGRVTEVRDQGRYGTCWAFASLGALETSLLPTESAIFSTDHMTMCNSYALDLNKGGEHSMSIAYLAAWQGPVYEIDDPYGDEKTDSTLNSVYHLEEALIINERNYDTLKSAIFRYGAIETSLYSQMEYVDSVSPYYDSNNASYYYDGEEVPNHDVVVVGWDDEYPKENFTIEPEGDGAFICKNSWGTEFGDDGYFYVSYYDVNICNKSVVYTRVGSSDNYDKIYQADLLGWVGLMGFGKEEAYFANVYTAGENEELAAISFYATGEDTEFEVYFVSDFVNEESLKDREFVVAGSTKHAGYYTVDFPIPKRLTDNAKYAVVVKIKTPGAVHPIAIEYNADERTENFDISDGEGYISLFGELWHSAEKTQNCNVCLKAFTNFVDENSESDTGHSGSSDTNVSTEGTTEDTEEDIDDMDGNEEGDIQINSTQEDDN